MIPSPGVISILSIGLAVLVLPPALYLGALAALAWRLPTPRGREPESYFVFVLPAHDEEAQIAATVESAFAVDYPPALRRVLVVADNCIDATADAARAAGAEVLERVDPDHRGKGFALDAAFSQLESGEDFDAVVVVDADSVVSPNILRAFEARLSDGANAVQAEYGVRNVNASWRTRLMAVALGMFHRTRSLARERLGVSAGLRGNGMCFSRELLLHHPHRAHGLTEDVEYGIEIGLGGHRVAFAAEAWVRGEMVSSAAASLSQRRRWEGGRIALLIAHLPVLLREAWRQRSPMLADLAMDILVPPLSYVAVAIAFGLALEAGLWLAAQPPGLGAWLWGAAACCLGLYVARGVQHSGLGLMGLVALAYAPIYIVWKIVLARPFRGFAQASWKRTQRESEQKQASEE